MGLVGWFGLWVACVVGLLVGRLGSGSLGCVIGWLAYLVNGSMSGLVGGMVGLLVYWFVCSWHNLVHGLVIGR